MKPLMIPTLSPQFLPPSARSGSQSRIEEEVIRIAREVYEKERIFLETKSSTKEVVSFGNLNFGTQAKEKQKSARDLFTKIGQEQALIAESLASINSPLEYTMQRFELVKKLLTTKKIGNCDYLNLILQDALYRMGINTAMIHTQIVNQKRTQICLDHHFLVTLVDPKTQWHDPKTWGNALVLDAWAPFFGRASDALTHYKAVLGVDETIGESLAFKVNDLHHTVTPYLAEQHAHLVSKP